ncbi:hypothetical protein K435DRAFT_873350 [Dendrothele bispora CBS 962.96]|uniref:Uncharacterized protein n=1 Tax=Dendrothele bispora (strain CBS 962.96) TaxID=1314807 RepID=A0A4S8KZR2_DENBC|nr:hypothetical protein K435DRAFT_873350 [Dendrothele bispora CBS 962.96]
MAETEELNEIWRMIEEAIHPFAGSVNYVPGAEDKELTQGLTSTSDDGTDSSVTTLRHPNLHYPTDDSVSMEQVTCFAIRDPINRQLPTKGRQTLKVARRWGPPHSRHQSPRLRITNQRSLSRMRQVRLRRILQIHNDDPQTPGRDATSRTTSLRLVTLRNTLRASWSTTWRLECLECH